ncbi:3-oxoacyl-ACP synthase [Streptomyces sp. HU2014]|uniref:3-oxoacyl-[acyl-carrier-protein] synthase III C-terminal domain-containing protein n=1 Tax=Streptomyces sp. HU2014 TaxID=2939414 RepID=UPI00200E494D|nr:3-oxoacyl-[acyl-carrier-protein] synthase III C-terminal domain-containing protein [Streptomyces sp. HU2014]UQI48869.1 3-oxoacyl-ACP synthase [Streptomyces sp. HU2014]
MRPVEAVGITAAELWLPDGRERASDAVGDGRLRARAARELGHDTVPAAEDVPAPDMAVEAARTALAAAGVAAGDVDMVCHAWMYYQGHDLWSPAHYIAARLGAHDALPVGVQQVCNGGSAAVELTAAWLAAARASRPGTPRRGLLTTGDRFAGPGFDRWAGDYGVVYGDAGTAVLLTVPATPRDPLVLLSVATAAAPELEAMHRGTDPFAPAARTVRERVDMRATKRAYLTEWGSDGFNATNEAAIRKVVADALRDAGSGPGDPRLRYAVLPRFGLKSLNESWIPVLSATLSADLLDPGRDTGHLGAGDSAAGLAELVRAGTLAPGERALVFSAGAGFTWSCLVVERPAAPPAD